MTPPHRTRLYLSPPHVGAEERALLLEAFDSNWVAPLGPHVDAFQEEFARYVGAQRAVALASGTAAIHLALLALGVGPGDDVVVSTLTFAGSVFPIRYVGATPVLVDSDERSWNLDPALLERYIKDAARRKRLPKAVIPVHLYGQTADMDAIREIAARHGIPVIEDAAEALGASYRGRQAGTLGELGIYSFNGNKVITTSGGGMVVGSDPRLLDRILKLATQAREPFPHYEHREVGYNYRLSNLLAALGRGQLARIEDRVEARRRIFEWYHEELADVPGVTLQPEAGWGRHSRWLTVVQLDPAVLASDREDLRRALEAEDIEARPLWKPMHLQPVFADAPRVLNGVSDRLFARGLCLPSGTAMERSDVARTSEVLRRAVRLRSAVTYG